MVMKVQCDGAKSENNLSNFGFCSYNNGFYSIIPSASAPDSSDIAFIFQVCTFLRAREALIWKISCTNSFSQVTSLLC